MGKQKRAYEMRIRDWSSDVCSSDLDHPRLNGVVNANNLTFVDETYGTRITQMALNGRFTDSRFEIGQLSGRAGRGTVTGRGSVDLSAAAGFPIDVRLVRSEEHTSELQSLMRISYAVFCLKKKNGFGDKGNEDVAS